MYTPSVTSFLFSISPFGRFCSILEFISSQEIFVSCHTLPGFGAVCYAEYFTVSNLFIYDPGEVTVTL